MQNGLDCDSLKPTVTLGGGALGELRDKNQFESFLKTSSKKDTDVNPFTQFEKNVITNIVVKMKMPLGLTSQQAIDVFKSVSEKYPQMVPSQTPDEASDEKKNKYVFAQKPDVDSPGRSPRQMQLSNTFVAMGAARPLTLDDQYATLRGLAEVIDASKLVSPLFIDYVDFKHVVEFKFKGNHHRAILQTLFRKTPFYNIINRLGAEPTDFDPTITARCKADTSIRYYFEIRPATSVEEIDENKFDDDEIAAIGSVVKRSDFRHGQSIGQIFENLKTMSQAEVDDIFVKMIVEPLSIGLVKEA